MQIGLLYAIYQKTTWKVIKEEFTARPIAYLIISIAGTFGYYFIIKAFMTTDKSIVVPINNSYTIIIVLLGIIFLKERTNITRKLIAAGVVFGGIVALGLA